jgi:hypothetical protein
MSKSFIGYHMSRPFRPQTKTFIIVDSCVTIFVDHIDALVCIHVEKCFTFGGFLASFVNKMAPYLGLDHRTSVGRCHISQFTFPSILIDMD